MARKTTVETTTKRGKKKEVSVHPASNGGAANLVNLEEAIRRRAYELYLERRATSAGNYGDENQDWLLAEREIRSRQDGQGQHAI